MKSNQEKIPSVSRFSKILALVGALSTPVASVASVEPSFTNLTPEHSHQELIPQELESNEIFTEFVNLSVYMTEFQNKVENLAKDGITSEELNKLNKLVDEYEVRQFVDIFKMFSSTIRTSELSEQSEKTYQSLIKTTTRLAEILKIIEDLNTRSTILDEIDELIEESD